MKTAAHVCKSSPACLGITINPVNQGHVDKYSRRQAQKSHLRKGTGSQRRKVRSACIQFQTLVPVYEAVEGTGSSCLRDTITPYTTPARQLAHLIPKKEKEEV